MDKIKQSAALLVLILATTPLQPQIEPQCNIEVLVGEKRSIEVTAPCMDRTQLKDILISVLSRDNKVARQNLESVLKDSEDMTLTLTTKHRRRIK